MVNSPNFDGQVKTISNDNGKSVAEEEQAFPSGTIITNNGTYAQQGQPQYAPPGMAGYAPGPAYPQGGYYPQQFYGHPGAYYQNAAYPNQRGGYGPPGMAQYNYGSQYGGPPAGQEYNQPSGMSQNTASQISGSSQMGESSTNQVYGQNLVQSTSSVTTSSPQQFVGQYQQHSIPPSNIDSRTGRTTPSIDTHAPGHSTTYQQNGAPQGYASQSALSHHRVGRQW